MDLFKLLHGFVKVVFVFLALYQTKTNWSWLRFRYLLKPQLWAKGVEWVKVQCLGSVVPWQCLIFNVDEKKISVKCIFMFQYSFLLVPQFVTYVLIVGLIWMIIPEITQITVESIGNRANRLYFCTIHKYFWLCPIHFTENRVAPILSMNSRPMVCFQSGYWTIHHRKGEGRAFYWD